MKICFFGIYTREYSRNDILLTGLKEVGAEVVECQADWRDPKRYFKMWKMLSALHNDYDCVYVAYPSPVATIIAKLVSNKLVVADAFYSMFDAVVKDRREISTWHPRALKLLLLDWLGVMFADLVITDTKEHQKYWSSWFLVNQNKIHTVYLGINDKLFYPVNSPHFQNENQKKEILVHFHGKYIPLQGVPKIIEAARLCRENKSIRFRLVGSGHDSPIVRKLVSKYGLRNVEFIDRIPLSDLNKYMSEADILLGIFGNTPKAQRVIPNKVYEGLAARKALITMDTKAVREFFSDIELFLVENTSRAIAEAITLLAKDKKIRDDFAERGYKKVSAYLPINIAQSLVLILSKYI